jgi:hypothetical protein
VDTQVEQHPEVVRARSALERRAVAFRPIWKGKRVNRAVIARTIREDPDPANRRRAYYALDPLYRPMEGALRDLVRIRNERSRALGYRTFAELRLGHQGLTPARIEALGEAVTRPASAHLRSMADRARSDDPAAGWHPWDLRYQQHLRASLPTALFPLPSMLPTILRAVRAWGFRTERMRFRVVFHDLTAGGLTLAPDPPRDVRILVHPQPGWHAYRVMFHEVGHAVQSASIRAPRHLLRWHENVPGFGGFHEGIGHLFEEVASSERWLSTQRGISPEQARAFATVYRDDDLVGAANLTHWIRIEQALYRNPERDPMPEAHRFERRLYGYDDYPPRTFADSFYIDAPSYAPNYLLATLFQYQLAGALRERFGEPLWPNPRVGPWLTTEWFAPGSLYDWVPRIRELTGHEFGARDFQDAFPVRSQ